jgi:hypothetical protein
MMSTIEDVKRIDMLKWLHKENDFREILSFSNEMGRKFLAENKPNVVQTLRYLLLDFIPKHIDQEQLRNADSLRSVNLSAGEDK